MKKFLVLLVALVMLFSLIACTPESSANPPSAADKQAQYEKFFTYKNFKTAGESITITNGDVDISLVSDHSENTMMEIRVLENYLRIYHLQDGKQYINLKLEESETWSEFNGESDLNAIDSAEIDLSAADIDVSKITRVEYVETKDGTDVLKLYMENPYYNEEAKVTEYHLSFLYNGEPCEMIVTSQLDGDGGLSMSYDTQNVADDFDIFNYSVDFENKVLIRDENQNEKISFEITSQKEIVDDPEICLNAYVDEAAQVVTSMQQLYEGELVTVKFYDVASCLEGIQIPETLETYTEEDLGMAVLGIIFSAVDFETE